ALSFGFSALSVALIRKPEPRRNLHQQQEPILREIIAGWYAISSHPLLRALVGTMLIRNFFGNFFGVLYDLYAVRELGLTPALLGFVVATGGIGSLAGAMIAQWLPRRFGFGRAMAGS